VNPQRRVVVTGMGIVSPIGCDLDTYWLHLASGKSGVLPIELFDTSGFDVKIAAEVRNFDPADYGVDSRRARRMDRSAQFGVVAASQAITHSKLDLEAEDLTRIGVLIGSGIGGIHELEVQHEALMKRGSRRVSPLLIPKLMGNASAAHVAIMHGLKGPNLAVATACATASHAIGLAMQMIQCGLADVMVAGGSEAGLTPISVSGFQNMKALSLRNSEPEKASRPFDRDRDGFVVGEGAGVIIVEALDRALARKAPILCEIKGFGFTSDAFHLTAPEETGIGAKDAMEQAVRMAGIEPSDVDYINAHGTSTRLGDIVETRAIKKLFGKHAYTLVISSTKSMIGHLLGASGGAAIIATVLSIKHQTVHPTINLDNPDPACDLDYVPHKSRSLDIHHALSNSFGFGGHNAAVLVSQYS